MDDARYDLCPCGSKTSYLSCCEPFITGKKIPETPESLMRSRYTAYTMVNIDYIKETMRGQALTDFQEMDAIRWAKRVKWIKLHVMTSVITNTSNGTVVFEAVFVDGARLKSIHEKSDFIYENGRWYYIGGTHLPTNLTEKMISRNMNCPCGKNRKFKNCHGHAQSVANNTH